MGYEQLCPSGHVTYGGGTAHGANADYILVPSRTLVHLDPALSFEEGAAISCGTGTAWNGLKKMAISGRDTVAVFGQGPVGLSGTLSAKAMGARVIAVDVVPERLSLARELGADHVINSRDTDPVAAIRDLTRGAGASVSLEDLGQPHRPAASAGVPCSIRPMLLRRRWRTSGNRLQPRRDFQGGDRLWVVDVQQVGAHRNRSVLRRNQHAPGKIDNPPFSPGPGGGGIPGVRRCEDRQMRLRHELTELPSARSSDYPGATGTSFNFALFEAQPGSNGSRLSSRGALSARRR